MNLLAVSASIKQEICSVRESVRAFDVCPKATSSGSAGELHKTAISISDSEMP